MTSKVFDLETAMESVSICDLEKAKIACLELIDGYFTQANPDPWRQAHNYDTYATFANIVLDYIIQAQQNLNSAKNAGESPEEVSA